MCELATRRRQPLVTHNQACTTRYRTRAVTALNCLSRAACYCCCNCHRYGVTSCDREKSKKNKHCLFPSVLQHLIVVFLVFSHCGMLHDILIADKLKMLVKHSLTVDFRFTPRRNSITHSSQVSTKCEIYAEIIHKNGLLKSDLA